MTMLWNWGSRLVSFGVSAWDYGSMLACHMWLGFHVGQPRVLGWSWVPCQSALCPGVELGSMLASPVSWCGVGFHVGQSCVLGWGWVPCRSTQCLGVVLASMLVSLVSWVWEWVPYWSALGPGVELGSQLVSLCSPSLDFLVSLGIGMVHICIRFLKLF